VNVQRPSSIDLSYGWVVDDNPEVRLSLSNTSSFALPGFYGEPSRSLLLVKDGTVVAEAWPASANRNTGVIAEETAPREGGPEEADIAIWPAPEDYWGLLNPAETLKGTYLWRDVNGCWTESGHSAVESGTYTLVLTQSLYLNAGGYDEAYPLDVPDSAEDAARNAEREASTDAAAEVADGDIQEPALDIPAPYEWAELQVWFSLGDIVINS